MNLGNKDDVFAVADTVTNRIRANTGNANDSLSFADVNVNTDFLVNTGAGRDSVAIEGVNVGDDINLVTGNGADRVFADDFQVADVLKVSLGRGDDTLWMNNSSGGRTTLNTGSDNDEIGLHSSTFASKTERGVESTSFGLQAGQDAIDALFSELATKVSIFG